MIAKTLAFLLLFLSVVRADESGWSQAVNGLRCRLVIPAEQHKNGDPFVRVQLELQNTLNVMGGRQIRYPDASWVIQITDESGKLLLKAKGPYDVMSANPDVLTLGHISDCTETRRSPEYRMERDTRIAFRAAGKNVNRVLLPSS